MQEEKGWFRSRRRSRRERSRSRNSNQDNNPNVIFVLPMNQNNWPDIIRRRNSLFPSAPPNNFGDPGRLPARGPTTPNQMAQNFVSHPPQISGDVRSRQPLMEIPRPTSVGANGLDNGPSGQRRRAGVGPDIPSQRGAVPSGATLQDPSRSAPSAGRPVSGAVGFPVRPQIRGDVGSQQLRPPVSAVPDNGNVWKRRSTDFSPRNDAGPNGGLPTNGPMRHPPQSNQATGPSSFGGQQQNQMGRNFNTGQQNVNGPNAISNHESGFSQQQRSSQQSNFLQQGEGNVHPPQNQFGDGLNSNQPSVAPLRRAGSDNGPARQGPPPGPGPRFPPLNNAGPNGGPRRDTPFNVLPASLGGLPTNGLMRGPPQAPFSGARGRDNGADWQRQDNQATGPSSFGGQQQNQRGIGFNTDQQTVNAGNSVSNHRISFSQQQGSPQLSNVIQQGEGNLHQTQNQFRDGISSNQPPVATRSRAGSDNGPAGQGSPPGPSPHFPPRNNAGPNGGQRPDASLNVHPSSFGDVPTNGPTTGPPPVPLSGARRENDPARQGPSTRQGPDFPLLNDAGPNGRASPDAPFNIPPPSFGGLPANGPMRGRPQAPFSGARGRDNGADWQIRDNQATGPSSFGGQQQNQRGIGFNTDQQTVNAGNSVSNHRVSFSQQQGSSQMSNVIQQGEGNLHQTQNQFRDGINSNQPPVATRSRAGSDNGPAGQGSPPGPGPHFPPRNNVGPNGGPRPDASLNVHPSSFGDVPTNGPMTGPPQAPLTGARRENDPARQGLLTRQRPDFPLLNDAGPNGRASPDAPFNTPPPSFGDLPANGPMRGPPQVNRSNGPSSSREQQQNQRGNGISTDQMTANTGNPVSNHDTPQQSNFIQQREGNLHQPQDQFGDGFNSNQPSAAPLSGRGRDNGPAREGPKTRQIHDFPPLKDTGHIDRAPPDAPFPQNDPMRGPPQDNPASGPSLFDGQQQNQTGSGFNTRQNSINAGNFINNRGSDFSQQQGPPPQQKSNFIQRQEGNSNQPQNQFGSGLNSLQPPVIPLTGAGRDNGPAGKEPPTGPGPDFPLHHGDVPKGRPSPDRPFNGAPPSFNDLPMRGPPQDNQANGPTSSGGRQHNHTASGFNAGQKTVNAGNINSNPESNVRQQQGSPLLQQSNFIQQGEGHLNQPQNQFGSSLNSQQPPVTPLTGGGSDNGPVGQGPPTGPGPDFPLHSGPVRNGRPLPDASFNIPPPSVGDLPTNNPNTASSQANHASGPSPFNGQQQNQIGRGFNTGQQTESAGNFISNQRNGFSQHQASSPKLNIIQQREDNLNQPQNQFRSELNSHQLPVTPLSRAGRDNGPVGQQSTGLHPDSSLHNNDFPNGRFLPDAPVNVPTPSFGDIPTHGRIRNLPQANQESSFVGEQRHHIRSGFNNNQQTANDGNFISNRRRGFSHQQSNFNRQHRANLNQHQDQFGDPFNSNQHVQQQRRQPAFQSQQRFNRPFGSNFGTRFRRQGENMEQSFPSLRQSFPAQQPQFRTPSTTDWAFMYLMDRQLEGKLKL